jgi:type I restriction enzyme S subunit
MALDDLNQSIIDFEYAYHALRNRGFADVVTGSAQPQITRESLSVVELPLAPRAEQRRIVAKLETLSGKVNASQQRLAKIPKLLKRFRQSILAAACSGRLTADWREQRDQDDEWPVHKLSELGRVTGGITKNAKRQSISLQVPYLRVANVYQNRLELDEVLRIGVTQQELERTRLVKGDLLFVEGNGSLDQIGRLAMWDGSIPECVHQNHLIKFRAGNLVEPRYVLLQMMSQDGRSQLVEKAISSAGLHSLSISKISDVNLPVAPLPEQQEIERRVEGLFALADQLEARLSAAQRQVGALTPSLLARAFSGQLVPQNPTDEPAQKLLERIRDLTQTRTKLNRNAEHALGSH